MFPIRDNVPSRIPPIVTWGIIIANVIVFAFELTLSPQQRDQFFFLFGIVPAALHHSPDFMASGLPVGNYWSLLTSMFLHGGLLHIGFNMWTLWIFGDNVEDRMGHGRFLTFYLLMGTISGLFQSMLMPNSPLPTVGASGAIAGVLGAYFLLYPRARVIVLIPIIFIPYFFPMPAFLFLGIWLLMQIVSGSISLGMKTPGQGGVAWWAHIGGFSAGMLLHRLFLTRCAGRPCPDEYDIESAWETRSWRARHGGRQ